MKTTVNRDMFVTDGRWTNSFSVGARDVMFHWLSNWEAKMDVGEGIELMLDPVAFGQQFVEVPLEAILKVQCHPGSVVFALGWCSKHGACGPVMEGLTVTGVLWERSELPKSLEAFK